MKKLLAIAAVAAAGYGVWHLRAEPTKGNELVRDRILYAVDVFGDPSRVHVTPDCGLRTRSWDIAYLKLQNMVQGTQLAKSHLGL